LEADELMRVIGHDGGEKVTNLEEPLCRRGFHIQEIIDALLVMGFAVTEIEADPGLIYTDGTTIDLFSSSEAEDRLKFYIGCSEGVIYGDAGRCRHALACSMGEIFDPDTGLETELNIDVITFFKVDNLLWATNGLTE